MTCRRKPWSWNLGPFGTAFSTAPRPAWHIFGGSKKKTKRTTTIAKSRVLRVFVGIHFVWHCAMAFHSIGAMKVLAAEEDLWQLKPWCNGGGEIDRCIFYLRSAVFRCLIALDFFRNLKDRYGFCKTNFSTLRRQLTFLLHRPYAFWEKYPVLPNYPSLYFGFN